LNTASKTGAVASFFIQAKSGTKYETIYQTKMDNYSFNPNEESINKTIQRPNQAYFGRSDSIPFHQECEVKKLIHAK
jgi:hypothetical protein